MRHDYAADKRHFDREHEARLVKVPNAARLLAALNTAPHVDERGNQAAFDERVLARTAALTCAHSGLDMPESEVTVRLRRCGL